MQIPRSSVMRRRDISNVLLASMAGAALPSSRLDSQTLAGPGYPETAAEVAAGLAIANRTCPPGCVDRYGSNAAPGTTSMVQAFNGAIKQAKVGGAQVTYGGTAPYLLDLPVNCTFAGSANQHGVV